jgi:hypothetical protein
MQAIGPLVPVKLFVERPLEPLFDKATGAPDGFAEHRLLPIELLAHPRPFADSTLKDKQETATVAIGLARPVPTYGKQAAGVVFQGLA